MSARRTGAAVLLAAALAAWSASPAHAAVNYTFLFPHPQGWINEVVRLMDQWQLVPLLTRLAWGVLVVGVAWGGVRVAILGLHEARGLFWRLAMASIVLGLATTPVQWAPCVAPYGPCGTPRPVLTALVKDTWAATYDWGRRRVLEPAVNEAVDSLANIGVGLPAAGVAWKMAKVGLPGVAESLARSGIAGATSEAGSILGRVGMSVLINVVGVQVFLMSGFYTLLVVLSASAVLIGLALLPLVGAAVALPGGTGAQWTGKWIASIITAILTAGLLPVMFAGAVKLTLSLPASVVAEALDETLQAAQQASERTTDAVRAAVASGAQEADDKGGLAAWVAGKMGDVLNTWWNQVKAGFDNLKRWLVALVVAAAMGLVGFVGGVALIVNVERYVAGYIGGLASDVMFPSFVTGRLASSLAGLGALSGLRWPSAAGVSGGAAAGVAAASGPVVTPEVIGPPPGPIVPRPAPKVIDAEWRLVDEPAPLPPPRPALPGSYVTAAGPPRILSASES